MKSYLISLLKFIKYWVFRLKVNRLIKKSEIEKFKNIHDGERCFIIGNGPSLKTDDLIMLENEITFSCNMIHRYAKDINWTPYYYFCHDPRYVKEFADELAQVECLYRFIGAYYETHKFVTSGFADAVNTVFYHLDKNPINDDIEFSDDVSKKVMPGSTVSYAMIQFAFYMGFTEIYLIGFDHSFSKQIERGKTVESNKKDHFEGYGVVNKNTVNKDAISEAFSLTLIESKKKNINVFNVTRGGDLNIFERKNLEDILSIKFNKESV